MTDFNQPDYLPKLNVKKDYQHQEFINPYFDKKTKTKGFRTTFYLKIMAGLFLFYLVFYSDLLKINQVAISGNEMIDSGELQEAVAQELDSWRWYVLPQRNVLWLSKNRLRQGIEAKYSIESLEIDKGWKSLKITVKEKISHLILYNQEKFYFLKVNGQVLKEVSREEAEKYWDHLPILNIEKKEINVGDQIVSEKMVDFIIRLDSAVKNRQLAIFGYEQQGVDRVDLVAKEGWRAYFDINSDPVIALENLMLVLQQKVSDRHKLQYVDLRFGDKVYFKR